MPVVRGLFISLIAHIILSWLLYQVPSSWLESEQKQKSVEIEIINQKEKDDRQVVRATSIPEAQKSLDEALARFVSAQKQRVHLETKARDTGMTKNRTQNNFEKLKRLTQTGKDVDGYQPVDFTKALQEKGISTVGEALPIDLAVGSFTALNTDKYQFYSFYSRVEELVRFRWETKVREALTVFSRKNLLARVAEKNWVTQAVFILSPEGRLQKIQMMKESGVSAFDQAATAAFQDVQIFPNPPREMVESDGFIHLKYGFNVQINPSAVAQTND